MRRFLKFLHTMGAVGLLGAMASLLVLLSVAPPRTSLAGYAAVRGAMGAICSWLFLSPRSGSVSSPACWRSRSTAPSTTPAGRG